MNNQKLLNSFILILSLFAFSRLTMNARPIEKNRDFDIVFIGNSITQGGQFKKPLEEAPPATASEYLRKKPGVGSVEFINQGRSGYTTVDFLPSTEGALAKVIAAARQLHKDSQRLLVFSVSLGTNDSAEKGPNGSPVNPDSYQKNLKSIADQLLADFPECKIIFQQPIWYSPNTYNNDGSIVNHLRTSADIVGYVRRSRPIPGQSPDEKFLLCNYKDIKN